MMMSSMACVVSIMSSLTAVSPPASCVVWLCAGFALDTVLSFDGLLIFLVSSIAVALFAFSPLTVALSSTLIIVALTFYRMHEAHSAFVALGPGLALPSSVAGFWRATQISRRTPNADGTGFLEQTSLRSGSTPYTVGTTLHKQINQQPPEDVQQYFVDRLALFAATQSDDSTTASIMAESCGCISSPNLRTFGCSVCSPQRSNCSAHVILHPADLEKVIRTGRGEIHPLANTGCPFSRFGMSSYLPGTLALIYAPREYSEVCTVMRIIEAGAKYLASINSEAR